MQLPNALFGDKFIECFFHSQIDFIQGKFRLVPPFLDMDEVTMWLFIARGGGFQRKRRYGGGKDHLFLGISTLVGLAP